MTLRYDNFLTPFASPALGKIDVSGLGDAARMLEQRSQYDLSRQDRLTKEANDLALEKEQAAGKNRYYDAQAETHRMAVEQAKNADQEKRARGLFDAFRKAKSPGERQAVMDELRRSGFSVEEQASDLPAVAAAPSAAPSAAPESSAPAVSAAPAYPKPPKPNRAFASALGQFMANENDATASPEAPSAEGGIDQVMGSPAAASMGRLPSMSSASTDLAAPQGKGKFLIKDKSGIVVHAFDEPVERAKSQAAIQGALSSLGVAAATDRERAAADAAAKAGGQMLDLGLQPDQAVRYALDVYGKTLNGEFKKVYPQGHGSGAAGPTKTELAVTKIEGEERNRIITRVSRDFNVKAADEVANFAQRALDKMNLATGTGDYGAFADWLKEESGKVVTDREREQFMSSAGGFTGLKNKVDRWTNGGRFDPEYMGEVRQLMETMLQSVQAQKAKASETAASEAAGSGLSPQSVDVVRGHFSGQFTAPPKGGKGPAADTRSDEDLVRSWKAGRR